MRALSTSWRPWRNAASASGDVEVTVMRCAVVGDVAAGAAGAGGAAADAVTGACAAAGFVSLDLLHAAATTASEQASTRVLMAFSCVGMDELLETARSVAQAGGAGHGARIDPR